LTSNDIQNEILVQSVTDKWNPTNDFISNQYAIYQDNFGIPYKRKMIVNAGYFTRKLSTGYYKKFWMSLVNTELYFFNDRDCETYSDMFILTRCYVTKIDDPIVIERNRKENHANEIHYPIELNIGGMHHIVTIYFDEEDS
jgi:hypothetical protein